MKNFQPYIYNHDKEITPEQDAILLSSLRFASTTEVKDDRCQKCPEMSLYIVMAHMICDTVNYYSHFGKHD